MLRVTCGFLNSNPSPRPANTVPTLGAGLNYPWSTKGMYSPMAPGITAEVPQVQTTEQTTRKQIYKQIYKRPPDITTSPCSPLRSALAFASWHCPWQHTPNPPSIRGLDGTKSRGIEKIWSIAPRADSVWIEGDAGLEKIPARQRSTWLNSLISNAYWKHHTGLTGDA